jgi:hypothetical protein
VVAVAEAAAAAAADKHANNNGMSDEARRGDKGQSRAASYEHSAAEHRGGERAEAVAR